MKSNKLSVREELKGLSPLFLVSVLLMCCVFVALQYKDELTPTHVEVTHAP
ncbi:hypothetical protein D3C87_796240 [compost metagenome]